MPEESKGFATRIEATTSKEGKIHIEKIIGNAQGVMYTIVGLLLYAFEKLPNTEDKGFLMSKVVQNIIEEGYEQNIMDKSNIMDIIGETLTSEIFANETTIENEHIKMQQIKIPSKQKSNTEPEESDKKITKKDWEAFVKNTLEGDGKNGRK